MKFRLVCVVGLTSVLAACAPATGYGTIVADSTAAPVPTTTAPPPPREVPAETHTGKGDGEFAVTWPADQLGFFTFDCPKCRDNVMIDTDGGEFGLVNAIGAYKGTSWLNTYPDEPTTKITVRADAAWTATIADRRSLPVASPGKEVSGKGDAVLQVPEGVTTLAFTAKTRGNVGLWVMSPTVRDLLVNEIGNLSRTVRVVGPALVRVEGYETSWTITPS
ncbi:hypothetical protein [Amycolatopsis sp. cmx-4-68]|uniref:hypothetical protein n=1 Tax=Amycolatopsis sp. cmx-4-68 TaxID=2790938 RepID=UPI00397E5E03